MKSFSSSFGRISPGTGFALLVVLFALTRLGTLLTSVEQVSYGDELRAGNITKAILDGLPGSLWSYQVDYYSGESLVIAFLAFPFFILLGPTLLALKLVVFSLSLGSLILLGIVMARHFGWRPALVSMALLVFAPAGFYQLSLVVMTGHSECIFFTILALLGFFEFLSGHRPGFWAAWTGFFTGFAFWMYHAAGIFLITCLAVWILKDRNFWKTQPFILFLAGGAVGFSPWLLRLGTHAREGIVFFGQGIADTDSVFSFENARRLLKLILIQIPLSPVPENLFLPLRAHLTAGLYSLGFTAAVGLWLLRRPSFASREHFLKTSFFLLFPLVFCLSYAVVRFPVLEPRHFTLIRYLTPVLFWGIPLLGLALSNFKKTASGVLFFAAVGIASWPPLFFQGEFNEASRFKGYSFYSLADLFLENPVYQSHKPLKSWEKAPDYPDAVYFDWASREAGMPWEELRKRGIPENFEPFYHSLETERAGENAAAGFDYQRGSWRAHLSEIQTAQSLFSLGFFRAVDFDRFLECCSGELETADSITREWFLIEAGRRHAYRKTSEPFFEKLSQNDRNLFFRGAGQESVEELFLFRQMPATPEALFATLNRVLSTPMPETAAWEFMRGLGSEIRLFFPDDRARSFAWIRRLPPGVRSSAEEGFLFAEARYGLPNPAERVF